MRHVPRLPGRRTLIRVAIGGAVILVVTLLTLLVVVITNEAPATSCPSTAANVATDACGSDE